MSNFLGPSSQSLRRPVLQASTAVLDGAFEWALVHQFGAADIGQLKAACLVHDEIYVSGRKGISKINCETGR